jgi:hypothetical protein
MADCHRLQLEARYTVRLHEGGPLVDALQDWLWFPLAVSV